MLTGGLSACAIGVLLTMSFPASKLKTSPHFLILQVQCIWFYVEVFDPFGAEFCAG